MDRVALEKIVLDKLREWTKRCGLPGIISREYPNNLPTEYFIAIRIGPGIALRVNNQTKAARQWDIELRDCIKNKNRIENLQLLYADPKFFDKIEGFIKAVVRSRSSKTAELAKVLDNTPIFEKQIV